MVRKRGCGALWAKVCIIPSRWRWRESGRFRGVIQSPDEWGNPLSPWYNARPTTRRSVNPNCWMTCMAEAELSRDDVEKERRLPAICMHCGAPATTHIARKYHTIDALLPPEAWFILKLVRLIFRSPAKTVTILTPLCRKHARAWFTWTTPYIKSITDESIVLVDVSKQFAAAAADHSTKELPKF